MTTRAYEAKTLVKHISCDCKCKFNSKTCNSNQKWNNETCQCECKRYRTCKKDLSWNRSTCICENARYLKSVGDNSAINYKRYGYCIKKYDILYQKMSQASGQ